MCLAVLVLALTACQSMTSAQPASELPSAVIGRSDIAVAISANGQVEPGSRADLAFEGSGRVAKVLVQEGQQVQAGDELASLQTDQLDLQVEQATAALRSAEARLAQLKAGPRDEDLSARTANAAGALAQVEASRASLDQLLAGVSPAQIAAAEADLVAAEAQQRSAKDIHDMTMTCKVVKLPDGEKTAICPALGPIEEQARYNLEAAEKALAAAQAGFSELLAGANSSAVRLAQANLAISQAQADAAQAQIDVLLAGPLPGELAAAEAQVRQAQIALEQAQLAVEKATLRSPVSGVVAVVNVLEGEAPLVGRAAISVIDVSELYVSFSVDELDVGLISEGQEAQVTIDALAGRVFDGVVSRVAPAAGLNGGVVSYDVLVKLNAADPALRVDMSANVLVGVDELDDVLVVPTWLVRVDRQTGQTYVERRTGDQVERVEVVLGVRREGLAEVLSGLSEGDVVVRMPDSGLFPFDLGG